MRLRRGLTADVHMACGAGIHALPHLADATADAVHAEYDQRNNQHQCNTDDDATTTIHRLLLLADFALTIPDLCHNVPQSTY